MLVAQVPAHAVLLNPTIGLDELRCARSAATLHVIGKTMQPAPSFIHYARSTDGGRTWPQREVPLAFALALGDLDVHGDHVHAAVNAFWTGPHVISSHDGGATWLPPIRVSASSNVLAAAMPLLHVDGDTVNIVWPERRDQGKYWTNRSTDGGLTWLAHDVKLGVGVPASTADGLPQLVAHGASLHVFWSSVQPQTYTAHQRSLDGGATWLPTAQLLTNVSLLRAAGSPEVLVITDQDATNLLGSTDQGATWTPLGGHGITRIADLTVHGSDVLMVGRLAATPASTVQLQVSVDRGVSWLPTPYLVAAARTWSATARATSDAQFVHFVFANDSFSPLGVVIQSDDFGVGWRLLAGDASRGFWASDDGGVALSKTGYSGTDVLAWVCEGHTNLGSGTAGAGGFVPELRGRGLAGLGRIFALEVGSAPGGSFGAFFTGFGPATNVPLGTATQYLQQPIVTAAFTTSGLPGVPGVGTASLPVAVPASAALSGYRLLSQAFVVDPAVADGFVATRAVESWIR